MSKINNKLILILAIFAFVFGLSSLASPVYAVGGMVSSGLVFTPTYTYNYPTPEYAPAATTPTVIPGCEGRTTGFSTITGQSCVNNYVPPKATTTTTVSKTTTSTNNSTSNNVATTTSDTNPNYSSLTASALMGSSNSFMPSGLVQWILFALLILLIIYLWRYIHHSEEKYMSEPLKHA